MLGSIILSADAPVAGGGGGSGGPACPEFLICGSGEVCEAEVVWNLGAVCEPADWWILEAAAGGGGGGGGACGIEASSFMTRSTV